MTLGLSTQLKASIIARRKEGKTWGEIAREFNLTKGQVAGVLYRAGLSKKKEQKDESPWRAHVGRTR